MNAPDNPSLPSRGSNGRFVGAIVIAGIFLALGSWSLCAGIIYVGFPSTQNALQQASQRIASKVTSPVGANDWWTARVLSQVYTTALDAAAADPTVIEQLGEPIEPRMQGDDLYRRKNTSLMDALPLDPQVQREDTLEFDIQGPKGSAVVTVVSSGNINGSLTIKTIAVTLSDGTLVEVTPPKAAAALDPNSWWTNRVLAQAYTAALDATAADPAVTEQLGEPIEASLQGNTLFRRKNAGPLDAAEETIEFDIEGTQGRAVVTVVSSLESGPLRIQAIIVKLAGGEAIEVPPPKDQEFAPR